MNFADRLAAAIERTGTFACVGIDPVLDKLPEAVRKGEAHEAIGVFSRGIVDAVAGLVPIAKLQSGCFERYGSRGFAELERTAAHARDRGVLVLLDAKRGDIGITAEHYAAAAFDHIGADALTVSPYLGPDTIEPFVRADRGLFVLVRTSNPGSDAVQSQRLADGRSVGELVADQVRELGGRWMGASGLSSIGAVVGATKASDAKALRGKMPNQVFLVPGYGAQGGTAADIRGMVRPDQGPERCGVLVTASRTVIYPKQNIPGIPHDWKDNVRSSVRDLIAELSQITSR